MSPVSCSCQVAILVHCDEEKGVHRDLAAWNPPTKLLSRMTPFYLRILVLRDLLGPQQDVSGNLPMSLLYLLRAP